MSQGCGYRDLYLLVFALQLLHDVLWYVAGGFVGQYHERPVAGVAALPDDDVVGVGECEPGVAPAPGLELDAVDLHGEGDPGASVPDEGLQPGVEVAEALVGSHGDDAVAPGGELRVPGRHECGPVLGPDVGVAPGPKVLRRLHAHQGSILVPCILVVGALS